MQRTVKLIFRDVVTGHMRTPERCLNVCALSGEKIAICGQGGCKIRGNFDPKSSKVGHAENLGLYDVGGGPGKMWFLTGSGIVFSGAIEVMARSFR